MRSAWSVRQIVCCGTLFQLISLIVPQPPQVVTRLESSATNSLNKLVEEYLAECMSNIADSADMFKLLENDFDLNAEARRRKIKFYKGYIERLSEFCKVV